MKHTGTVILETPRLILRPFVMADTAAMFENWAGDPEVTEYLTWQTHDTPRTTQQVLAAWVSLYEKPDFYQWAIVPKDEGRPIGSIAVVRQEESQGCAEIGYCIGKRWWRRGITAEALGAVIAHLFDNCGFQRIEARHDVCNPRSGGVMQKCGMTCEGTVCHAEQVKGRWVDICTYAILRG